MSEKESVAASAPEGVSFRRLTYEAIPEMWSFQFWISLILSLAASVVQRLIGLVAEAGGNVSTTANLREVMFSWRSPILLILGAVLVLLFIVLELFAQILMNRDVLGGQESSVRKEAREAFAAARRFLTPLYILAYVVLILALLWFEFRSIFSVHAVLIDGMTPAEGRKESLRIIKAHGKAFAWGMFKVLVVLALIQGVVSIFFDMTEIVISLKPDPAPEGYLVTLSRLLESGITDTDAAIIRHRVLCAFVVLFGSLIKSIAILLCGTYTMLRFTRYYLAYSREEEPAVWQPYPKKARYIWKALTVVFLSLLSLLLAIVIGFIYDDAFTDVEPPKIIEHRAGGTMASENSLEGLELAIRHGCYASEIDVQRTKDGYYIINHDNDFKRLAGVAKAPSGMTMDEIRGLRIQDTTGNGQELSVVTMEEEMATDRRVNEIHAAGKEAIVRTVNTASGMRKFLDGGVDGIITDEIELAERTRKELGNRTVIQVLRDQFGDIWE